MATAIAANHFWPADPGAARLIPAPRHLIALVTAVGAATPQQNFECLRIEANQSAILGAIMKCITSSERRLRRPMMGKPRLPRKGRLVN
jgi:hypothetical protein